MDENFKDIGSPALRLVEECAELIKAVMKAERFGYDTAHPDSYPCHAKIKEKWCDRNGPGGFMGHTCGDPHTNMDDIIAEGDDVVAAYADFIIKFINESNE